MAYKFLAAVAADRMDMLEGLSDESAPPAVVLSPGLDDTVFFPSLQETSGELVLEPGDGPAASIVRAPVRIFGYGGTMQSMPQEAIGKLEGELYVTSSRLVFVGRNFDHGVGSPFTAVGAATRAITATTAKRRSTHRFIAAQIRHPWLLAVGVHNNVRFSSGEGLLKRKNALRVAFKKVDGTVGIFQFACDNATAVGVALLQRAKDDKLGITDLKDEHYARITKECDAGIALIQRSTNTFAMSDELVSLSRKRQWATAGAWSSQNKTAP